MTARCAKCGWITENASLETCRRCGHGLSDATGGLEEAKTEPRSRAASQPEAVADSQLTPMKTLLGVGAVEDVSRPGERIGPSEGGPAKAQSEQEGGRVESQAGGAATAPARGPARSAPQLERPSPDPETQTTPRSRAATAPAAGAPRGKVPEERLLAALAGGATSADGATLPPVDMGEGDPDLFDEDDLPSPVAGNAAFAGTSAAPSVPPSSTRPAVNRRFDIGLIGLWVVALIAAGAAAAAFLLL